MDKLDLSQVLNLRIDQDTFAMLRTQSVNEQRSMSAQVRWLIRAAYFANKYNRRQTTDKPPMEYAAE